MSQGAEPTVAFGHHLAPVFDLAVTLAPLGLAAADEVSVSARLGATPLTASSSGNAAIRWDELQYSLEEGPCVAVLADGRPHTLDPGASDEWPRVGPMLRDAGVGALVSAPVPTSADLFALNFYSRSPEPLPQPRALDIARSLARALDQARALEVRWEQRVASELQKRDLIAEACGILMAQGRLPRAQAFDELRRRAEEGRQPLAAIAAELITSVLAGGPQ